MSTVNRKATKVALLGVFSAIVVVLQMLSYGIKIGTFNLSLVFIPIVLGAVLYGPKFGAVLGGVFGVVVAIAAITGLDAGANIMFNASPFLTCLVCLVKGIAAGLVAGFVAAPLKGKHIYLAVLAAAVVAPVVNTGLFLVSMVFLFHDTLVAWAAGTDMVYYIIVGLVGINFVIEFVLNLGLSPLVLRVVKALQGTAKNR